MKNRFVLFIVLTFLTLGFTDSLNSQTPSSTPQIYQGCAEGPFTYSYPKETYVWNGRNSKGKMTRTRIDKVVTSEGRMVFTFVPENVAVYRNKALNERDSLNLEVFSFGQETRFGKTDIQNPMSLKSLKLPPITEMPEFKKSKLEEEEYQYLNWDLTSLETVGAKGKWYAIIHKKSDFNGDLKPSILPIDSPEKYLNDTSIPTSLIPPTFYYYKGKLVKVTGEYDSGDKEKIPSIANAIRVMELTSNGESDGRYKLTLDTTGLDFGDYFVTLQNSEVSIGQNTASCPKTTPPVVISIKEKKQEIAPPYLRLEEESSCPPFNANVTARAGDKNNPPRTLTFKDWKIRNQSGEDITSSIEYEVIPNSKDSQTFVIKTELEDGNYTVEVTVSNGIHSVSEKIDLFVNCPEKLSGKGAGIAYFGNATPNYRKGEIISDPEDWTRDTEKRNRNSVKYPSTEYERFYIATGTDIPPFDRDSNNTKTIERIVDKIKDYPNVTLYVLGYADRRFTPGIYRNDLLAEARVRSVVQALKDEIARRGLSNKIIGAGSTTINCSDNTANRARNLSIWSDILRWDRRVEIIFGYGDKIPERPSYAAQCPNLDIDLSR